MLLEILEGVRMFREGQYRSIGGALRAGHYLTLAKARLGHGEWIPWLEQCQVSPTQASRWMRLSALGIDAEEVQLRGGIRQTLAENAKPRGSRKSLEEQLEAIEKQIGNYKNPYYDALSARKKVIREIQKQEKSNLPKLANGYI